MLSHIRKKSGFSRLSQALFQLDIRLRVGQKSKFKTTRVLYAVAQSLTAKTLQRLASSKRYIRVNLWGRELVMGSDHRLPCILRDCPRFSEPIGLLVKAMQDPTVRFIDVGANIGDTVAIADLYAPGKCVFLCIEPDPDFVALCRVNTSGVSRATVVRAVIDEGATRPLSVLHHTPGTASAQCTDDPTALLSMPLATVAAPFVDRHGGVDIIKIDTDGFDAKVLRSSKPLLEKHSPMLFFELHPYFWAQAGENPLATFRYLGECGYRNYVFFTNRGNLYAQVADPTELFLETLVKVSLSRRAIDDFHYDVLTGRPEICAAVADMSLQTTSITGLL